MELTLAQKQAIAMANARMRMAQAQAAQQQPPEMTADVQTPNIAHKGDMRPGSRVQPDLASTFNQGALMNFSDEAGAAAGVPADIIRNYFSGGPTSPQEVYDQRLAAERAQLAATREAHPIAAPVSEIGGALATSFLPGGAILKGGNLISKAVRGAGYGAAYGGIAGFGEGEGSEDRLSRAKSGAKLGAAIGAVVPAVGKAAGKTVGTLTRSRNAAPSMEAIRKAAKSAYREADESGLAVSQRSYSGVVDDILQTAHRAGLDYRIHPKSAAALKRLVEIDGGDVSLRELETLRRVVQSVGKSAEPDERRLAGIIKDKIDDYMGKLGTDDVVAGDPNRAIKALFDARSNWAKLKKAETVEELMDRAKTSAQQFSGSGFENAIRTEFRALAKNARKMRTFSKEEQAAIKRVARGGPMENALRMLGKFAPTGVVSSALSGGIGFTAGGPAGAVFLPAAGFLARQGATAMTKGNVRALDELIRRGGSVAPQSEIARKAAEQLLLSQSGLGLLNAPQARPMPKLSGRLPAAM